MFANRELRSFERTYRAESRYVAAVLGRLAVPREAVGDAVQDVFVAAYRRWGDFDRGRPVRPWLTGFARKVAFRYRRSEARRSRRRGALRAVALDRAPACDSEFAARDFLGRFLEALDPGHRDAFLLAEMEGHTAPEVAGRLGITTEAVYGRVRTVRRRLRDALEADCHPPGRRAAGMVPPWSVVLGRLQGAGLAGTVLSAASVKTFLATVGVGLVGVGVVGATAPEPAIAGTPASPPTPARVQTEQTPQNTAVQAPAQVLATPEALEPVVATAVADVDTSNARARAERRGAPSVPPPETSRGAPQRSELAEETALVGNARQHLRAGNPEAALTSLRAHETRFPNGQLVVARRRARIRALCDLGRVSQARGEARVIAADDPNDPLAVQSVSICKPAIQNAAQPEKP